MSNSLQFKRTHFTHFPPSPRKLKTTGPSKNVWVKKGQRLVLVKREEAEAEASEVTKDE